MRRGFAQNSANIKAMSVSADGRIWGAAKRRIHYSPFTIGDLFKKLEHRLHKQQIKFRNLNKIRALRIFTGDDGTFRVNETGNLELWLPEKKKFVLSGFGVGLSWASAVLTISKVYCPQIIIN